MTIKMSTAARTAVFSTGLKNAFNNHCLCVYSGTEPASADAALGAAVRLLRISTSGLGTPLAFETPSDGVMLKKAADVWMGTNLATGTPSFYRLEPLDDTGAAAPELVRLQGSVGPAGDLRLDVAALVIDEVQPVNYFDLQMPASALG